MNKRFLNVVLAGAAIAGMALSGCGNGSSNSAGLSPQAVSGVVAAGKPISGKVTLIDSSTPAVNQTTHSTAAGSFSFDVSKFKAPFILMAEAPASGTTTTTVMYSFAKKEGRANINPYSNVTVGAAAGISDADEMSSSMYSTSFEKIRSNHRSVMEALEAKLAPLFEQYGVTGDPVGDDYESDGKELDALFSDVKITISKGTILVTNIQTGGIIFKALVTDIEGGTFYPQNLPGGQGTVDGAALYGTNCSSCHGPLATSSKLGATVAEIQEGISEVSAMHSLSTLSSVQIQAIASALAATTPSACTYTYSAWGTCQSNNTQTRTMLTSSPSGCSGTPTLSQSCTYIPPAPQPCTYTYSTWGTCQSNNTQTRTMLTSSPSGCSGTPTLSQSCTYVPPAPQPCTYTYSTWGTCQSNNTQTRTMLTSSPSGCTGTPTLSQSCTYVPPAPQPCTYTYSTWGTCQSNNTQTRTMLTSSPSGCTGTPTLSQSCTYVPPAPQPCTYTYSAWGTCQSNNTQTRTMLTSSPSGCSGTPSLSQSCTYTAPLDGNALYTQYCSGCHGSGKKGSSASTIQNAINSNRGGMGSLSFLTSAQITAISTAR